MVVPEQPNDPEPVMMNPGEVSHDPLFDAVYTDAVNSGVVILRGYIGRNDGGTGVRLFLSPEFSDYLDIPEAAVVGVADLRTSTDKLAGQAVWVRLGHDLTLKQTRVEPATSQADFVTGSVADLRGVLGPRIPGGQDPWGRGWGSPRPWWCWGWGSPRPWWC